VDSTTVGAPAPAAQEDVQRRTLTFWSDGFSIEDGPLHAYDAPGNRELLAAIHAGRAPLSLFNVQFDQPLELVVQQRTNEAFVAAPKKPAGAFGGEGNRLGSVVPTVSGANTPVNRAGTASPAVGGAGAAPPKPAGISLDPSKPAANIQLRLGDGSRVVARVNLDHTVADLRAFVNA
jgi:UBX domain-containing protein 1